MNIKSIISVGLIAAFGSFGLAESAHAWGDREQGALIGLVVGSMLNRQHQSYHHGPSHYPIPAPVYQPPVYQPPVVQHIYSGPVIIDQRDQRARHHMPRYQRPQIPQPIYSHQIYFDPSCNCYRQVEVLTGYQ